MHVCLLNDSFPPVIDGVANTVMNYASVLTEECGDKVALATPRYPGADYSGYPYEVIPYSSVNTSKLMHGYRAGYPFDIKAIHGMAENKPDIIHTHCPVASTIMARTLRNESGAPIIFTYHTKFDQDIARAVSNKTLQEGGVAFLVANISACDEVWTVSKGAGENLKSLGYKGEYRVMANGVDFAKGRVEDAEVKAATDGYDLPEDVPTYLFVGRLMTYKGLPIIVDAMKILSDAGKDFRMVFVGGGVDAEPMQQKAMELGLSVDIRMEDGTLESHPGERPGKVIFTGAIHDRTMLRAWNTRSDLFLFPSTYDTNGIVVREAAACGLASVLVRGSCAAEDITDGRNGFFIEENAESMAALLLSLYDRRDFVAEVGQNAMDEIYISWSDAVKTARNRYKEILALKEAGEFPIKTHESMETIVRTAEKIYDQGETIRDLYRTLYTGMMDNYYNVETYVKTTFESSKSIFEEQREEWRKAFEETKTDLKEELLDGFKSGESYFRREEEPENADEGMTDN